MERIARAIPIKPGKTEAVRRYVEELAGPRAEDDAVLQRKLGVHRQTVWLLSTSAGEFLIGYEEVEDPARMREKMQELQASGDPHLAWKISHYAELYDLDPNAGPPAPLEQLADRAF